MTVYVCEQCNGAGHTKSGERCPCRDEDDTATERRKQMGVCPHSHSIRADIAAPPRLMEKLPIDARGYPVPWFVDWIRGEPEFRAMDIRKFKAAIKDRLCWTCGNPLFREEIFVIGPMCAINRISSEPPSHRECAEYAAKSCPFLTKPHMHRRTDDTFEAGRKPSPGVMVERNPGVTLLWYTRRHELQRVKDRPGAADGVLFRIGSPFKLEWYSRGREATRAEVLEAIRTGLPLLYQAAAKYDGPEGIRHLEAQTAAAMKLIPR
jgi:hypothetical protein